MGNQLLAGIRAAFVAVILITTGVSGEAAPSRSYTTTYENIAKLTKDLNGALDPSQRTGLHPRPLLIDNMPRPYLQHKTYVTPAKTMTALSISSGFVDLMNGLSHAMAIDLDNGGYLKRYLTQLSFDQGTFPLTPVTSEAWSLDTMNQQQSRFNQIAGTLIAIEMANHYLGYYAKHGDKLGADQPGHINRFLTYKEWRKAVLHGANNALHCGLGVDGIIYFYTAIEGMSDRPDWADYFMPPEASVKKISKDLKMLESHFFAGRRFDF